jgi:hypothetical protein
MTTRSAARVAGALTAALLVSGCASAQEPGAAADAIGCYQFVRDAGATGLGLPWGFVLEDAALEPEWPVLGRAPDARRALTATSATARADHPFGYWVRTPGDTIEVGYPGFGGGFVLRLAPSGQDLIGLGRPVGDAVAPGQPTGLRPALAVTARRVLCGAS